MTINNSNKPLGSNIGNSLQKRAGATFGERRSLSATGSIGENQAPKARDFFSTHKTDSKNTEVFSSNAQFLGTKKVLPHKVIESGKAHSRPKISDDVRLAFLDNIIAGPAENRAPSTIKPAIKQTVRTIANLKNPIKTAA